MKSKNELSNAKFWILVWGLGIAGQICWNMENQWFNTFVYAKIAKDPTIISWMVGVSATATTISTFLFGCISDRIGKRKIMASVGYILWGIFTIVFGLTQYLVRGSSDTPSVLMAIGVAVVAADAIMSFFGSMGNDIGFNAWVNDHMKDSNKGQIGAALATQPVIGTIVGTVAGGMLVGSNDNYMRLFLVMGVAVILFGIYCLFAMKDSPELKPGKRGTFAQQFFSILNFKNYIKHKELAWVNLSLSVYFIAFNMYFAHIGNYMIYYLGFSADMMGYIEGVALVLAMLFTIPCTKLLNNNKAPLLCFISTVLNSLGVGLLGLFVRPENANTNSIWNPMLLLGVLLLGMGYVLFLQSSTVWGKQLYPEDARGQFEGIRILFFVLIPMVVAPLIANPIIKKSGEFVDENGLTAYLPTYTLLLVGAALVLLTVIPLIPAKKYHDRRISEKKAAQMLFEGVEEYLADKNFVADPDSLSGDVSINGGFYLPASAASDASVTYGAPTLATGGVFTIGSNTAGTTEPYYSVSRIKAPYGYSDAGAAQCYLPVTVKIGAVNITGNARLNIQRHLLTNTDATLEIGVPKLGAVQVTSANGSNVKMSTFKGSDTTIWSQTRITNIGNTKRKLLAGIAYYSADGRLLSISGTKSDELGFEVVTIAPGASSVISRAVKADKITTGVTAKFFVIDAETLKPSVKSIIISD